MPISNERSLRILTLFTTALTMPFLIASTIVSINHDRWYRRNVTAFCFGYIPLAMTALASAVALYQQRRHGRLPGPKLVLLDGTAFFVYLSILIPIWVVEIDQLRNSSLGALVGYTTSPMIFNM